MILTFTSEERDAIRRLGYSITSCRACREETIYSPKVKVPKTCGRLTCGRAQGEEWAERE